MKKMKWWHMKIYPEGDNKRTVGEMAFLARDRWEAEKITKMFVKLWKIDYAPRVFPNLIGSNVEVKICRGNRTVRRWLQFITV